jgi:rubredoxin
MYAKLKYTVIVVAKYRCKRCDEIYEHSSDALECCAPGTTEVFLCPVCNQAHEEVIAAMNCCDSEPMGEAEVGLEFQYVPKSVLEAGGQVRLFP